MPVHRHLHDKQGSVFAFRSELDAWWESRRSQLTAGRGGRELSRPQKSGLPVTPLAQLGRAVSPSRLILVALAILWSRACWLVRDRTDYFWRSPLANAKFTRLLDFDGTEQAAAISREGKFVAFLADREGQIDAWIGEVASGTYRNLTNGAVRDLVNPLLRTLGFSADSSLVSIWTRRVGWLADRRVSIFGRTDRRRTTAAVSQGGRRVRLVPRWPGLVYHTTAPGDPMFVRESGKPGDRRSMWRRRGCIATSRCGLQTMPLSILCAACRPMNGTSGEFDRRAPGSNG